MEFIRNGLKAEHRFESLAEMVELAKKKTTTNSDKYLSSRKTGKGYSWDLGDGFDKIIEKSMIGDPELTAKMAKVYSMVEHKIKSAFLPFPTMKYDVTGEAVDIGRAVAGEPEDMITFEEGETVQNKLVEIVVGVNGLYSVDAVASANRGAVILAVVDGLEKSGFTCSITGQMFSYGSSGSHGSSWPIKTAGRSMDIDRLAFALCHIGLFRRIGFAIKEHCPEDICRDLGVGDYGSGYGRSYNKRPTDEGVIYFPIIDDNYEYETPEKATKTILGFIPDHLKVST